MADLPERYQQRLELAESETEVQLLLDEYDYWRNHPISLEDLDYETLQKIPELTSKERDKILESIEAEQVPLDWEKLQNQLPEEVSEILQYVIALRPVEKIKGNVRWRAKFREKSDYQQYNKIQLQRSSNLRGVIVSERDPGELTHLDHVTGGLEIKEFGPFQQILVGQYLLAFGQGLSFGRSMSMSKSTNAISNADNSYSTTRLNSSSMETIGFLGTAARSGFRHHTLQAHYSRTPRDGRYEDGELKLSSSGLHDTELMRKRANNLTETLFGGVYTYRGRNFNFGGQYSYAYYQEAGREEQLFRGGFTSFWFQLPWLSHESAIDRNGNRAHYSFMQFSLQNINMIFGHRWYSPDYLTLFGNGMSEFSGTDNETGLYYGGKWSADRFRFQWYFEQFKEIGHSEDPARTGSEWMISGRWRIVTRMYIMSYIKNELKEVFDKNIYAEKIFMQRTTLRDKSHFRIQYNYRLKNGFNLKSVFDYVHVEMNKWVASGIQWSQKLAIPVTDYMNLKLFLAMSHVENSEASTYYFVMPATGTMQILRQTGNSIIYGGQYRVNFRKDASLTLFFLRKREVPDNISRIFAAQMDVAF